MKKRQYSQKNRNIKIEKTLETNNKHNITKFLIKIISIFVLKKHWKLIKLLKMVNNTRKNENQITNIFEDNNENLKTIEKTSKIIKKYLKKEK